MGYSLRGEVVCLFFVGLLWGCNEYCVVPNLIDFIYQGCSGFYVKEFYEADWSVEWRFCEFFCVFHVAVQLDVVDDFVYEGDLFLVE